MRREMGENQRDREDKRARGRKNERENRENERHGGKNRRETE